MYEQFFLHFSIFPYFFLKQCENYPFNYFLCFHITIIISITLKSNCTKERRMYEHVWTYFIYNYMFMRVY